VWKNFGSFIHSSRTHLLRGNLDFEQVPDTSLRYGVNDVLVVGTAGLDSRVFWWAVGPVRVKDRE
jgi:hypothetical protein